MSQLFFIFLLISFMAIRPILALAIVVARPLVPFFKKRLDFERLNFIEEACLPFNRKNPADLCFEVSSEGELEQVRALLEESLKEKKKIEIIYSSASVESKCQNLYKKYPDQVRLLRLPLLSGAPVSFLYFKSLWDWVSAPVVIFCRYDFFPELLLLKLFKKKFVLISGATKKLSWYKKESFKFFDIIVAATDLEKEKFQTLLPKARIYSCDFRVPRVAQRFGQAEKTLGDRPEIKSLVDKLEAIPATKKIILGSAWTSDLNILKHPKLIDRVKKGDLFLLLAPHKLDDEHVLELKVQLAAIFGEDLIEIVDPKTPYQKSPVVILRMGGILCELYSLFSISYVGGGYERSIHSVLEPFFSYNVVVTGPVVQRSTEFDLAFELAPGEIHVLKNPESFYTIVERIDVRAIDLKGRNDFLSKTDHEMRLIFKDIL